MRFYFAMAILLAAAMLLLPLRAGGFLLPIPQKAENDRSGAQSSAYIRIWEDDEEASPPESVPKERSAKAERTGAQYRISEPFVIYDLATQRLCRVNQRDYLIGAVCAEMPPDFHTEALKAQAVAAHSYAIFEKKQQETNPDPANFGGDFTVDTANWKRYVPRQAVEERFGERFEQWYPKIEAAVDAVLDQMLVYEGEAVVAAYHSMSNGHTEAASNVWQGSAPYLVAVESPGDLLAPDFEVTIQIPASQVRQALLAAHPALDLSGPPEEWFGAETRSDSGYMTEIWVGGAPLAGQELRRLLGLRSTSLEIHCSGEMFTFVSTGYGHGVGLSQYGADYLARQGMDYREILAHYYPGTELLQMQP